MFDKQKKQFKQVQIPCYQFKLIEESTTSDILQRKPGYIHTLSSTGARGSSEASLFVLSFISSLFSSAWNKITSISNKAFLFIKYMKI